MSTENEIKKSAEEAVNAERDAMRQGGVGSYTHVFKKPFTHEGVTYDELTFDFETLTGNDSLEVERDLLTTRGRTLVTPEFDSNYLAGMAARACTYREDGRRTVSRHTIAAMPIGDYRKICKEVQNFLLLAG